MKKLLLLFILFCPIVSFAEIDERKTDVYFANGIMNSKDDAEKSLILVKEEIQTLYTSEAEMLKYHNFDTLYNESYGMGLDIYEAYLQKIGVTYAWSSFRAFVLSFIGSQPIADFIQAMMDAVLNADLSTQIGQYETSIEAGHKMLVVAHSQGSLFTKDAYASLPSWMRNYVRVVGVAPPTSVVAGGSPIVSWDNDLVGIIGGHGGTKVERSNYTINALI